MTVREEASKGRQQGLVALRDRLADAFDDPTSTDVRSLSAIAGQLRRVLAELEEMKAPSSDFIDDMKQRRAGRLAGKRSGKVS